MLDKENFLRLYKTYRQTVRRVCSAAGLSGHDVDEATQDLWTRLWKTRERWQEPENEVSYIVGCARHAVLMHRRSSARRRADKQQELVEERTSGAVVIGQTQPTVDALVESSSLSRALRLLAEKLSEKDRATLLAGLNSSEPAIGETSMAVKYKRRRALKAARDLIGLLPKVPGADRAVSDPFEHLVGALRAHVLSRDSGQEHAARVIAAELAKAS